MKTSGNIFHMSKRNLTVKKMTLDHEAETYEEFMSLNQDQINRGIIEVFKTFSETKKKKIILELLIEHGIIRWKVQIVFFKRDYPILMEKILPYFTSIEDYDTCIEVRDLLKKFE